MKPKLLEFNKLESKYIVVCKECEVDNSNLPFPRHDKVFPISKSEAKTFKKDHIKFHQLHHPIIFEVKVDEKGNFQGYARTKDGKPKGETK